VGKHEGKMSCGRSGCRMEENIKTDLKVRWKNMDWTNLAQDKNNLQGSPRPDGTNYQGLRHITVAHHCLEFGTNKV
jgi:hypothetical protein